MKKNFKIGIAVVGLVASAFIGTTLAYFTNGEYANNVFTVGEVKIGLSESEFDQEDAKNLVAHQTVSKNPVVKNTGTNNAIVFVSFDIPKANVAITNESGDKQTAEVQEIFEFRTTGGDWNSVGEGWIELVNEESSTDDAKTYVYGYSAEIVPEEETSAVFDEVRLIKIIEGYLDGETYVIPIKAYAIQSDDILLSYTYDSTDLSESDLSDIYEIYMRQNNENLVAETEEETEP